MSRLVTCPSCKGNGFSGGVRPKEIELDSACEMCCGSGSIEIHKCKFCGADTVLDPADQSPPFTTCDHSGEVD